MTKLDKIMTAKGVKNVDLARAVGCAPPEISRLRKGPNHRSGRKMTLEWAKRLAPYLGCDWRDVADDDESQPPEPDPEPRSLIAGDNYNKTYSINVAENPMRPIREIIASSLRSNDKNNGVSMTCDAAGPFVDSVAKEFWMLPRWFVANGLKTEPDQILAVKIMGWDNAPTLTPGDVVFIDTASSDISPPGLYGMRDPYGKIIVHRLDTYWQDDRQMARVMSDNPKQPERLTPIESITVVGRVCGVMKAL